MSNRQPWEIWEYRSRSAEASGNRGAASGIYVISVVSRILDMHPQTLRKYERLGMVTPSRSMGMLRLYSEFDVAQLRLIKHLVSDLGLNLAGVRMALHLFNGLVRMKGIVNRLEPSQTKRLLDESVSGMMKVLERGSG